MGGAKGGLDHIDVPAQGECPNNMCVNLEHCADRGMPAFKVAFVLVHSLDGVVGARFKEHHHTMKTIHAEARKHHADTIVMVPGSGSASSNAPLSFTEKAMLKMAVRTTVFFDISVCWVGLDTRLFFLVPIFPSSSSSSPFFFSSSSPFPRYGEAGPSHSMR